MSASLPTPGPSDRQATRRSVVVGGCAAAAAACLAGCARYGEGEGGGAPPTQAPPPGGITVPSAQVPVGGGVVLADRGVVVTQPRAGTFAAFGTTCPHQGCAVSEVANGLITCPCHGSEFRIADGSVANGPATKGLPRRTAAAQGGQVRIT